MLKVKGKVKKHQSCLKVKRKNKIFNCNFY